VTSAFDQTLLRVNEMALLKIGVYEGEFVHTTFDLDHARLLKNVRAVQHAYGIDPDPELQLIREKVPTPRGDQEVAAIFREQIRYTVEAHLRRQEQLREKGLKVLSLFFIDRVENYTGDELPNLVAKIGELLEHTNPPLRLTRRTILAVIRGVRNQQAVLDNPEEFATQAAEVIRARLEEHLINGIVYEKDGNWYDMELFPAELVGSADRMVEVAKSIYARLPTDSDVERKFVRGLEKRDDVKLYVKLPSGFKVRTPVGDYTPDWGIVLEERNQFGDPEETLYLVRETKGTLNQADLYLSEQQKIKCGTQHFDGALGVDFDVLTSADDLKAKRHTG
jgi:restriction endonuclease